MSSSGVPLKWIRRKSAASATASGQRAVAQAARGDEQAGGGLLRQPDQLDLALHGADQAVVEAVVVELVGDLQHDVAEAASLDPLRRVDHRGAHGGLVGQDLVLPLVEAAEDDHQPGPVARLDDTRRTRARYGSRREPSGSNAEFTAPS